MIARILRTVADAVRQYFAPLSWAFRTLAELLRNRRADRAQAAAAELARAEREARQIEWLRRADERRREARRLFAEAQAVEDFRERCALYCQALAEECRGEACHALAGGDAESAAQHTLEAEGYDRQAGVVPVESVPVEPAPGWAAHA